jgi:hypothetical protein
MNTQLTISYNEFYSTIENLTDVELESTIEQSRKDGYHSHEERMIFIALVNEKGKRIGDKLLHKN